MAQRRQYQQTRAGNFVLSYQGTTAGKLRYTVTGNLSHFANKITQLPEDVRLGLPRRPNHSIIGHSQYSIFGYKHDGIFQNAQEVAAHATQPAQGPAASATMTWTANGKWMCWTKPGSVPHCQSYFSACGSHSTINFDLSLFGSGVASVTVYDPAKGFNTTHRAEYERGPGVFTAWTPQIQSLDPCAHGPQPEQRRAGHLITISSRSLLQMRMQLIGYTLPKTIALRKRPCKASGSMCRGKNLFAIKSGSSPAKTPNAPDSVHWPVPTPPSPLVSMQTSNSKNAI